MSKKTLFLLFVIILLTNNLFARDFDEVYKIAQRRVPWLSSSLVIQKTAKKENKSSFSLETKNNNLYILATDESSASMGLGWYLKYYCHRSMSHLGDNLSAPKILPTIDKKVVITSPYQYRYALNYCTISYSMSSYKWNDWERELDWLALNGVNLLLVPVGMEIIWQNTLLQLGFSQKETFDFIAHPTFSAWWLMGNLQGWGNISQMVINQQKKLQQKILKRMRKLGIEPILQGFYGAVPTQLKQKYKINVVPQGNWAGGFLRPDFLNPNDSMFSYIAKIYYDEIKKTYGTDFHYFGGEPFHEGGKNGGLDVGVSASIIQKEMQKSFPNSTWVLQGWGGNPSKALISQLDKNHTLIIDLFGENQANWEKRKGYENTPFIWCNVTNFGENSGSYGKLQRFANEVDRIRTSQYLNFAKGVGIIPEGIYNNPVVYDFTLHLGWKNEKVEVDKWIEKYLLYRYGKSDKKLQEAWQIFLKTVYSSPNVFQEGASESIFCARPSKNSHSVSTWGSRKRNYDMNLFKQGVRLFMSLDKNYKNSQTYQIDKIDFLRQVLSNNAEGVYKKMVVAINNKDIDEFEKQSSKFLRMIKMQDTLTSQVPYFTLNYWLSKAQKFGSNSFDKKQTVRNLKMQISIWGHSDNPNTNLHDYAHKEWSGILSTLYYNRWKLFIDNELAKLKGMPSTKINYFEIEKQWVDKPIFIPKTTLSEEELNEIIKIILS